MANDHDTVAYDVQDGIAWLRFNRPDKRNAMSPTATITARLTIRPPSRTLMEAASSQRQGHAPLRGRQGRRSPARRSRRRAG